MRAIRTATARYGLIVAWCLWAATAVQAAGSYRLSPVPDWVDGGPALATDTPRAPDGLTYLLRDEQTDVGAAGWSEYFRVAYRIDARGRLEYGARFEIEFNPEYQRAEIHHVTLLRGNERIERSTSIRAELMRREDELESDVLDGVHTLNVLIPDVRVGDVIDVAYTVHGSNPVFAGGYHDAFGATFGAPLARRRIRIRHPAAQPLHWKLDSPLYTVDRSTNDDIAALEFVATDLPARDEPDDVPSWYSAYGSIRVSTHAEWRDVARWAVPKLSGRFNDRAVAAAMRAELGLDAPDIDAIERAVAFVQRDIRYTGLSLGEWTHTAYPPEQTLERRYGDCKDKTVLLVALLAEIGIDAWPVLVDTDARATIADQPPSPLAFDHAIVQVRFGGNDYWIDPTRAEEHGPLAQRTPLPFGYGLPVSDASRGLVAIPWPSAEVPDVDVDQTIALLDDDDGRVAEFSVVTTYRGIEAERIVDKFDSNSAASIGEQYRDYMDDRYDGIEAIGEPALSPRAADGAVTVSERYRWKTPEDDARYFSVDLFQIGDWLPDTFEQRDVPLVLDGPRYGRQRVRVTHSGGWSIEPEDQSNRTDEFRFDRSVAVDGDALVIDARWQRFSDAVSAERLDPVKPALEQNWELQSFTLDFGADEPDTAAWFSSRALAWPFGALAFTTVFVGVGYRRRQGDLLGMLFAPRSTVARALDAPNERSIVVGLLLVGSALAMLFEQGAEFAAKPAAYEFGAVVGAVFGGVLQSLLAVALAALGLRLVGRPARYGRLLTAYAWASVPALGLMVASLIAIGGRISLFAEDTDAAFIDAPAVLTAGALAIAAVGWMLVAMVNGYAQVTGASRWRALAGLLLGIAVLALVIAVVVLTFS